MGEIDAKAAIFNSSYLSSNRSYRGGDKNSNRLNFSAYSSRIGPISGRNENVQS